MKIGAECHNMPSVSQNESVCLRNYSAYLQTQLGMIGTWILNLYSGRKKGTLHDIIILFKSVPVFLT